MRLLELLKFLPLQHFLLQSSISHDIVEDLFALLKPNHFHIIEITLLLGNKFSPLLLSQPCYVLWCIVF